MSFDGVRPLVHKILDYMWQDEKKHFSGEDDHIFYVLIKLVLTYKVEALYTDILRTLSSKADEFRKIPLPKKDRDKIFKYINIIKNTDLYVANNDTTFVCSDCISPDVYIQQFVSPNDGSTITYESDYEMVSICEYCNFEECELVPLIEALKKK